MKKVFLIILAMILTFSVFSTAISVSAETVDKTALEALVAEAEGFQRENFKVSDITWSMFVSELEYAQSVLTSPYATQEEVNRALQNLGAIIPRLGPQIKQTEAIDMSELQAIISEAVAYNKSDFEIEDVLWNDFQVELANAIMTVNDSSATQQEIDNAKNNLVMVMEVVDQYRIYKEEENTQPSATQKPNGGATESNQTTTPTESVKATSKPTTTATEPVTETRPKSTTPFLQGGFIELGCDASVALSALAVAGIIGAAFAIKKKEK